MLGIGAAMLDDMMLPEPLIAMVPGHVARTYQIVPVEITERNERKIVSVATIEPDNIAIFDDLRFMLQVDQVQPLLADQRRWMPRSKNITRKRLKMPTALPTSSSRTPTPMATTQTLATTRSKMSTKWISPALAPLLIRPRCANC